MRIYIRGKNEKICKKEVKEIVNFFGTHLLGPRLNKNITLEIIYRHDFKDDLYGLCGPVDWDEMRSFEMLLNPHIPKTKQINTLAHEMVHLCLERKGASDHADHDTDFNALAAKVCNAWGWDFRKF